MGKKLVGGVIFVGLFVSGCATTQSPSQVSLLQNKIGQLEDRLDERNREVVELKSTVNELMDQISELRYEEDDERQRTQSGKTSVSKESILRVSVSAKDVQKALRNAGFYKGVLDGKLGTQSQKAISAFQKENNLKVDGVIGKKTWDQLKGYLD